jgi:hypothetical protein
MPGAGVELRRVLQTSKLFISSGNKTSKIDEISRCCHVKNGGKAGDWKRITSGLPTMHPEPGLMLSVNAVLELPNAGELLTAPHQPRSKAPQVYIGRRPSSPKPSF